MVTLCFPTKTSKCWGSSGIQESSFFFIYIYVPNLKSHWGVDYSSVPMSSPDCFSAFHTCFPFSISTQMFRSHPMFHMSKTEPLSSSQPQKPVFPGCSLFQYMAYHPFKDLSQQSGSLLIVPFPSPSTSSPLASSVFVLMPTFLDFLSTSSSSPPQPRTNSHHLWPPHWSSYFHTCASTHVVLQPEKMIFIKEVIYCMSFFFPFSFSSFTLA